MDPLSTNWYALYNLQRIGKEIRRLGNKKNRDHPNYSVIKFGQNTEKSPGDMRRHIINQTPMRNHHVMLAGKNLKGIKKKFSSSKMNFLNILQVKTHRVFYFYNYTIVVRNGIGNTNSNPVKCSLGFTSH